MNMHSGSDEHQAAVGTACSRCRVLEARIAELEAALAPFAAVGRTFDEWRADTDRYGQPFTMAQWRAAAKAVEEKRDGK